MTPENDLGNFIKEQLETAHRSPNDGLWDRVQHSLDRRRRRKIFFLLFLGFTGITVPVLFFAMSGGQGSQDEVNSTITDVPPTENTVILDSIQNASGTSESDKTILVSGDPDPDDSEAGSNIEFVISTTETDASNEVPDPSFTRSIEEGSEVTTRYHYYNSENQSELETTEKAVIDSILNRNTKSNNKVSKEQKEATKDSLVQNNK